MENEKYLSEEKYQKNKEKIKKIGKIILITGIIMMVVGFLILIIGFTGFGNTIINGIGSAEIDNINNSEISKGLFGDFGLFALGAVMDTFGFGLIAVGGMILFFAHRREITAFTTQQVMPVAQEGIEKITPTVANAAESVAQSISKGIKKGKEESENNK